MGPPIDPPNWFCLKGGLDAVGETKKFFASKMLFRTNSNTLPWKLLLPDFVMTLITPPDFPPNSAS